MICCSTRWRDLAVLFLALAWLSLASGCGPSPAEAPERTAPNPKAPAAYGPPNSSPSPPAGDQVVHSVPVMGTNGLMVLQTELSPAVLVRAAALHLDLFTASTNAGLGAPAYITWTTMNGPRTFKQGEALDLDKTKLEECWLLVWWAGAEGWTNWDVPWVVYLQHKPQHLQLDADGLHLHFPRAAGDVVLLPLYGYEKLPQRGRDLLAEHGMAGRKVKTWDWPEVLKRDPLARIRYWAAVTRELPIHCDESFRVDAGADAVTFRSRFTWHRIDDDWKTSHLRLAPVSPTLGLAVQLGLPARLSKSWFDLDYFTADGPYLAVEGVEQFDITLPVLQYVHETERIQLLDVHAPSTGSGQVSGALRAAGEVLEKLMRESVAGSGPWLATGGAAHSLSNLWALNQYARALAFCSPSVRSNAASALARYFREVALATNAFATLGVAEQSGDVERVPRAHETAVEQGKIANALLLQALWAYAHSSGDWELPRERWRLVSSLALAKATATWRSPLATGASANGDLTGGCIALARLAYRVGDMKLYYEACAQFATELAGLVIKQRGAEFFRKHQPYRSMEFIDDEVFPIATQAGLGWRLDGPHYPATPENGERWFARRWDRFCDLDVARFCREYLGADIRRELAWLEHRPGINRHDAAPSFLSLRSLLQSESANGPARVEEAATANDRMANSGPPPNILADSMAMLRLRTPVDFQRLIPPFDAPSWWPIPRATDGMKDGLVCAVTAAQLDGGSGSGDGWSGLSWKAWKSPNGRAWTFGAIRVPERGVTLKARVLRIGSNASAVLYDDIGR